jgi:hypothetical protein
MRRKNTYDNNNNIIIIIKKRGRKIRWAMADIVKKWNFKMGAGLTGQFNRDSEDIVLLIYRSRIVICLPLFYD